MKKNIVHVIDSLGRGGAETMLVALLPELNKLYNIVLVTLKDEADFNLEQVTVYKRYSLGFNSTLDIFKAVSALKKIIKEHQPILVRTQLFWSTIAGRLATPKHIPLFFSVHSKLSLDAFKTSIFSYWLEKITYKKRHTLIAVSDAVLQDYKKSVGIEGSAFILNNFIHSVFFEQIYHFSPAPQGPLKVVAVGNLKEAKNYPFLLRVIDLVKDKMNIEVDIIGEGHLRENLQKFITTHKLPVRLPGKSNEVYTLLPRYDVYIMCSLHEGFGNSPVEAMAVGLPLLLNNSDTMKEMSKENALFYENGNENAAAALLLSLNTKVEVLHQLSKKGKAIAREYYNKEQYVLQLQKIYEQQ